MKWPLPEGFFTNISGSWLIIWREIFNNLRDFMTSAQARNWPENSLVKFLAFSPKKTWEVNEKLKWMKTSNILMHYGKPYRQAPWMSNRPYRLFTFDPIASFSCGISPHVSCTIHLRIGLWLGSRSKSNIFVQETWDVAFMRRPAVLKQANMETRPLGQKWINGKVYWRELEKIYYFLPSLFFAYLQAWSLKQKTIKLNYTIICVQARTYFSLDLTPMHHIHGLKWVMYIRTINVVCCVGRVKIQIEI